MKRHSPALEQVRLDEVRRPWQAYIEQRKLHASRARDAVVEACFQSSEHLTLEQLLDRARAAYPGVSMATVYRTVKLMEDAGIVEERHFQKGGVARYEVTAGRAHHDHLVCESCGTVVEFESEATEALQREIAQRYGFQLRHHRHELYGLCSSCQERAASRGPRAKQRSSGEN